MSSQRQPLYVANEEVRARLKCFITALDVVCEKYGFDLKSTEAGIEILDRRDKRPQKLREEWADVAVFSGVDSGGTYHDLAPGGHRQSGLDLTDYALDQETVPLLVKAGIMNTGLRRVK